MHQTWENHHWEPEKTNSCTQGSLGRPYRWYSSFRPSIGRYRVTIETNEHWTLEHVAVQDGRIGGMPWNFLAENTHISPLGTSSEGSKVPARQFFGEKHMPEQNCSNFILQWLLIITGRKERESSLVTRSDVSSFCSELGPLCLWKEGRDVSRRKKADIIWWIVMLSWWRGRGSISSGFVLKYPTVSWWRKKRMTM